MAHMRLALQSWGYMHDLKSHVMYKPSPLLTTRWLTLQSAQQAQKAVEMNDDFQQLIEYSRSVTPKGISKKERKERESKDARKQTFLGTELA